MAGLATKVLLTITTSTSTSTTIDIDLMIAMHHEMYVNYTYDNKVFKKILIGCPRMVFWKTQIPINEPRTSHFFLIRHHTCKDTMVQRRQAAWRHERMSAVTR